MKKKVLRCLLDVDMYALTIILKHFFLYFFSTSYCLDSSLNRTKAKGKVLVCRHAGSSSESKLEKGNIVKEAGGIGMILIDEADKGVAIPFTIPAATVGKRIGNKILAYINNTRFTSFLSGFPYFFNYSVMLLAIISSNFASLLYQQFPYCKDFPC